MTNENINRRLADDKIAQLTACSTQVTLSENWRDGDTKWALFKVLFDDPKTYSNLGNAWGLVIRLLVQDGEITESYYKIGEWFGVGEKTVGNWVKELCANRVITTVDAGQRVTLRLTDQYMAIVTAPDTRVVQGGTTAYDDPRCKQFQDFVIKADEMGVDIDMTLRTVMKCKK